MDKQDEIRETLREHLDCYLTKLEINSAVNAIMKDLIDHRLIGLPTDVRTSIDARLIEQVGQRFGCRPGDDGDDICKKVLRDLSQ